MKSTLQPRRVDLDAAAAELQIEWSDGQSSRHSMAVLRRLCPCTKCREERAKLEGSKGLSSLRVLQPSAKPAVTEAQIMEITPVGRYAFSFRWNDGHHTGIYSYEFLLQHAL